MSSPIKWVLVIILAGFGAAQAQPPDHQPQSVRLGELLDRAVGVKELEPTDESTYEEAQQLFASMFRGGSGLGETSGPWRTLGFELTETTESEESMYVLRDRRSGGRGFFAFRRGSAAPLIVQAPHAVGSDDQFTRRIALRLFLASGAAAAGWSTITRREQDAAHETGTLFQAFTESFARAYPEGRLVQIHGFRRNKRTTETGKTAEAILSNGTADPAPWLGEVTSCVNRETRIHTLAYPGDVQELGATTNAQGHLLSRLDHTGFLHVELSRGLRRKMIEDDQLLRQVSHCLSEGVR